MRGAEGELRRVAESALTIKPNFGYTLKEVKDDIQRVFDTGCFDKCQPHGEDTRDGIKLIVEVRELAASCYAVHSTLHPMQLRCLVLNSRVLLPQHYTLWPVHDHAHVLTWFGSGDCQPGAAWRGGHGRQRAAAARDRGRVPHAVRPHAEF